MSNRNLRILIAVGMVLLLAVSLSARTKHKSVSSKSSKTPASHKAHTSSKTRSKHARTAQRTSSARVRRVKTTRCSTVRGKRHCRTVYVTRKERGQQQIDADRAREIQAALIREHYLDGEPSGVFDQRTKNALVRFQQDNGWQTKIVPDSRALIKLGLGPSKDGLLNPESAEFASPVELGNEREIPGGATAEQGK